MTGCILRGQSSRTGWQTWAFDGADSHAEADELLLVLMVFDLLHQNGFARAVPS
jgi:hypothetical protein